MAAALRRWKLPFAPGALAAGLLVVAVILAPRLMGGNNYQIFVLTRIGLFTMLTVGLSLVMGYAGQVSLGHATFYGLGAYLTAILSAPPAAFPNWWPALPSWLALLVAMVLSGGVGYLLGAPIFRLRGHYLAMATLGLNVIFSLLLKNQAEVTGGPSGFTNIPPLSVGSFVFDSDLRMYYIVWAAALIILWMSLNIVSSRVGWALRAIHTSEVAAEGLGVDANAYKMKVFGLAAAFAGLAGGLYAQTIHFISPSSFSLVVSVELVTMSAIGGLASIWGSIFGAATVVFLEQVLRNWMATLMGGAAGEGEIIVFGLLLMVIMVFLPEGLTTGGLKFVRDWSNRRWQVTDATHVSG